MSRIMAILGTIQKVDFITIYFHATVIIYCPYVKQLQIACPMLRFEILAMLLNIKLNIFSREYKVDISLGYRFS